MIFKKYPIYLLLLTLFTLYTKQVRAQEAPYLIILDATLPVNLTYTTAVYDGNDSIYIIGGDVTSSIKSDAIYRYSISTEVTKLLGHLPEEVFTGDAIWDAEGRNIYYFNGASNYLFRIHINEWQPNVIEVETMFDMGWDNWLMFSTASWDHINKKAYSFGLERVPGQDFFEFDPNNGANPVKYLPGLFPARMASLTSVFDEESGNLYFFGGMIWEGSVDVDTIYKYNPGNGTLDLVSKRLPYGGEMAECVWDGRSGSAYIFDTGSYTHAGLMKFTPRTEEVEYLPIPQFQDQPTRRMGTAFVEKLNRIYLFGGINEDWWLHSSNRIQYVQLP